jgi:DNA repair exonuclease SbcCD nuclease subunit
MTWDRGITRILFTGDVHIGRISAKMPGCLPQGTGSATAAWQRIVDLAVAQGVDLVFICGDLVDADASFQEALQPVKQGISKLEQNCIPALAVAGNHDFALLPQLVQSINSPWLRLLGSRGTWQRYLHYQQGQLKLAVDGWSFPQAQVREDPVRKYQPLDPGAPVLAMAHGLLDVADTIQAPLDRQLMQSLPVHGWILGHYHHPPGERQDPGAPLVLYIGSAQALDASEPGVHGPWLAEVGPAGLEHLQQIALSDVRYESCAIDLTGLSSKDKIQSAVLSRVDDLAQAAAAESGEALRCLCLRLRLTGSPAQSKAAADLTSALLDMQLCKAQFKIAIQEVDLDNIHF